MLARLRTPSNGSKNTSNTSKVRAIAISTITGAASCQLGPASRSTKPWLSVAIPHRAGQTISARICSNPRVNPAPRRRVLRMGRQGHPGLLGNLARRTCR